MVSATTTERPTVRIIRDVAEWDTLAADWAALFAVSPEASTPLQFEWLRTWWDSYGADGQLRVVTFWKAARLVGALPLYERPGRGDFLPTSRWWFVSTGEAEHEETCPDYMNLLAAPGEQESCLAAFEQTKDAQWDAIKLLGVPHDSVLMVKGFQGRRTILAGDVCPIARLDGGFDAYLRRLSANARERSRRLLREAERNGAVLEFARPSTFTSLFEELIALHQQRWIAQGKAGCFAAPRFTSFHRALASQLIASERAVIARLSQPGRTLAVLYGFITHGKFDFYQSGVDTTSPLVRSPGQTAHLMLMRELCNRGIERYDFLRGSSSYKSQLATNVATLYTVELWRSAARASAAAVAERFRHAFRSGVPIAMRRRLRGR